MAIRILFILLLLVVSSTSHAQTRRAIVIGIGKHEDKTWGKINGDKDVPLCGGDAGKCEVQGG